MVACAPSECQVRSALGHGPFLFYPRRECLPLFFYHVTGVWLAEDYAIWLWMTLGLKADYPLRWPFCGGPFRGQSW